MDGHSDRSLVHVSYRTGRLSKSGYTSRVHLPPRTGRVSKSLISSNLSSTASGVKAFSWKKEPCDRCQRTLHHTTTDHTRTRPMRHELSTGFLTSCARWYARKLETHPPSITSDCFRSSCLSYLETHPAPSSKVAPVSGHCSWAKRATIGATYSGLSASSRSGGITLHGTHHTEGTGEGGGRCMHVQQINTTLRGRSSYHLKEAIPFIDHV